MNMKRPPKKHEMQYHEKKVGIAIPMRANIPTLLKTRAQEHHQSGVYSLKASASGSHPMSVTLMLCQVISANWCSRAVAFAAAQLSA